MYKKVKFSYAVTDDREREVVRTVLTQGYACKGLFDDRGFDGHYRIEFIVNRYDIEDLRRDVEILVKAGYAIHEESPE